MAELSRSRQISNVDASVDMAALLLRPKGGTAELISFHTGLNKGGGLFYYDEAQSRANHNGITIIDPTNTANLALWDTTAQTTWFTAGTGSGCWMRIYDGHIKLLWAGAKGDGVTDDSTPVGSWLSYVITNGLPCTIDDQTYLMNSTVTIADSNGLDINGRGVFKAGGSNRDTMLRFASVVNLFTFNEITIDGANIVARPIEIFNLNAVSPALGNIYIGPKVRIINCKNVSPLTNTASGIRIEGGFDTVTFEGEIDGVDSDLTSGGLSIGLWLSDVGGNADDWTRKTL